MRNKKRNQQMLQNLQSSQKVKNNSQSSHNHGSKVNVQASECDMSNKILVPTQKHQQLKKLVISVDRKECEKQYQENLDRAVELLQQKRFWYFHNEAMVYDTKTGLIWEGKITGIEKEQRSTLRVIGSNREFNLGRSLASSLGIFSAALSESHLEKDIPKKIDRVIANQKYGLTGWQLPSSEMVCDVVDSNEFPLIKSAPDPTGNLLLINPSFSGKDIREFVLKCVEETWFISWVNSNDELGKEINLLLENMYDYLHGYIETDLALPIEQIWKDVDYISTRLAKLDSLRFTDLEQGMWEFYAPQSLKSKYTAVENKTSVRARNPELDIKEGNVAIDFGTSSTVVAIRQHGRDELLRIGLQAQDFKRHEISDNDFENPTVLELLDIQQLLKDWHSESYRPLVDWNTVHCSHEARHRLRTNDTDPVIVGSIFARLKQWALRDANQAKVRITDSKNRYEYEFAPLTEKNPVKGRAIELDNQYPQLDPIELYAWFLGMNINWRERGIFLKYYMTFPVAYPNEVKQKILASFRRGLQRSLPESLLHSERFNEFSVQELASEPAAFAAAALRTLDIEPEKEGTAYAVFDFGGGTTDFDYGIYREPNDDEYDAGYDDVIEHFGSSGDKFLGGENLLENMAYLVFKDNQNICREHEIAFTKPIDAESFVGSERLIAQTQAAYTNTTLMMSKLRPLWEQGEIDKNSSGTLKLKLLNRQGERVDCELTVNDEMLIEYLQQRILSGFVDFFTALKSSFEKQLGELPETIHILLGGNSSRSKIVLGLLGFFEDDNGQILAQQLDNELSKIFGNNQPEYRIHKPLESDKEQPFKANTKTGVALGLLKVAPGESLKVINHASASNSDSPFQFYVGSHRRGKFIVGIKRGDDYGQWVELGRVRDSVFQLLYTTSAQAESTDGLTRGSQGLLERQLDFSGSNSQGKSIFARIMSPDTIEIGLADNLEQAEQGVQFLRQIALKI